MLLCVCCKQVHTGSLGLDAAVLSRQVHELTLREEMALAASKELLLSAGASAEAVMGGQQHPDWL